MLQKLPFVGQHWLLPFGPKKLPKVVLVFLVLLRGKTPPIIDFSKLT